MMRCDALPENWHALRIPTAGKSSLTLPGWWGSIDLTTHEFSDKTIRPHPLFMDSIELSKINHVWILTGMNVSPPRHPDRLSVPVGDHLVGTEEFTVEAVQCRTFGATPRGTAFSSRIGRGCRATCGHPFHRAPYIIRIIPCHGDTAGAVMVGNKYHPVPKERPRIKMIG